MAWLIIIFSGLFEVAWVVALKESHGFSRLVPTLIFFPLTLLSVTGLGIGLKTVPAGPGYTVWVGMGALGTVLAGVLIFGETIGPGRLIPLALIASGVIWLATSGS